LERKDVDDPVVWGLAVGRRIIAVACEGKMVALSPLDPSMGMLWSTPDVKFLQFSITPGLRAFVGADHRSLAAPIGD
jgi:hypothetical protein